MTSTEKIAAVVGIGGAAYFLFGATSATAAVKKLPAAPALKKTSLASVLGALLKPAKTSGGGSSFAVTPNGGVTAKPTPITPTPTTPVPKLPTDAGPVDDWSDALATFASQDATTTPTGTLPSGPLTFSDGSTIDLNTVDPTTGKQLIVIPTQPDGGDSRGIIQSAIDWSAGGDGGDDDAATASVTATVYGATVDPGVEVVDAGRASVDAASATVAPVADDGVPAGYASWADYFAASSGEIAAAASVAAASAAPAPVESFPTPVDVPPDFSDGSTVEASSVPAPPVPVDDSEDNYGDEETFDTNAAYTLGDAIDAFGPSGTDYGYQNIDYGDTYYYY